MTIRELETRSKIPRTNIRYYESQGLLHPRREENGYRNYSKDDAITLEKVRLLRSLGLAIGEILQLQQGSLSLSDALIARLAAREAQQRCLHTFSMGDRAWLWVEGPGLMDLTTGLVSKNYEPIEGIEVPFIRYEATLREILSVAAEHYVN